MLSNVCSHYFVERFSLQYASPKISVVFIFVANIHNRFMHGLLDGHLLVTGKDWCPFLLCLQLELSPILLQMVSSSNCCGES